MKIVSFNVNSLRQRLHQLQAVIDKHDPVFIGLQETKVQDKDFPLESIRDMGYHALFMGQKTHYGVALLSKQPCNSSQLGFPGDDEDAQKRFIGGSYTIEGEDWYIYNGYFPQGESRDHPVKFPAKEKFYRDLNAFITTTHNPQQPVVIMGDYNIAPDDKDIGIGEDNAKRWLRTGKTSFLPEERTWFEALCQLGYHDGFRVVHPDQDQLFSWFDYRSRGFEREPRRGLRIDHVLVTERLKNNVSAAGIDYDIRSLAKPSDHAPVWIELRS
ncbi:MAG: exodeoxyribonuclease III [Gammaproteobacteria bacterium]|nr:exodeoxyribonuclease III [Gammaproteobacteria bacterium]